MSRVEVKQKKKRFAETDRIYDNYDNIACMNKIDERDVRLKLLVV